MTVAKDLAELGKLIAAQYGWPSAKAFKAYEMSDADRVTLTTSAVNLLSIFPDEPDTGAMLSAAFAVQLERALVAPIHVVAGTVTVEGEPVFSDPAPLDRQAILSTGDLDWRGHVWVMVGPYVADISIFRAAYSRHGAASLSRHVDLVFGPNKALYVDAWTRTRRVGLVYEPRYVFSAAEVTALMGGAYRKIEAQTS
jgi:hypothetical protein